MNILLAREKEYIPEWNNNKKEEKPIKAYLKALSPVERNECSEIDFDMKGRQNIKLDWIKLFKKGVSRIENLVVDGKSITKPDDVLEIPGLYEFVLEVGSEVYAFSGRKDPKN